MKEEAWVHGLMGLVASDRPRRGASPMGRSDHWTEALALLEAKRRVAVITGFYVLEAKAAETDGPGGALVLARALERDGKRAIVVTDSLCFDVVAAGAAALGDGPPLLCVDEPGEIWSWDPDLLLYVERPGRCRDGTFRNMRGRDISSVTAPLDGAALEAPLRGVSLLSIGDGGNEAGMASFLEGLSATRPEFAPSLCCVPADVALAVDVSNWGAYALGALLSCRRGIWLGHDPDEEERLLRALVAAGAVDGVSGLPEPSVDGFPLEVQCELVAELQSLWRTFTSSPEEKGAS
ncbi:DUF4392 domain-containing protein [Aminithiophilus ramosus]|uniref:DUF4392 domain-containing protein n=1 Tax=Aminithiophilus ramosus TaxID=3029084 RepID=A0A9Q7ALE5_9BACT|nr:DUF4392 domain-containing protein [Aminithiophilus ramosus]QTX31603.1 DUF4392 domain-containing protein [Aminithiophilus ramosus]